MPEPGLTLSDQARATDAPAATLDGAAPSAVWRDLADALEPAVRDAVRELLARDGPTHHADRADVLVEAGLSAATDAEAHALATILAGYDRAPETAAHEAASTLLRAFGQSGVAEPLGWHVSLSAVGDGPLALLEAVDATPTVTVRLREAFFDQRADQRREVCRLLDDVRRVAAVRILATGRQQRKLAELHRADLAGVSEACSTGQGQGPLAATVETARGALDPEGRPVTLLRSLAAEPGETLTYADCYAEAAGVGKSRVRQCLGRLADLDLVATFGPSTDRKVELLAAGREFLATLDAEIGRQASLEAGVSESGQTDTQAVLSREHGEGGGPAGETAAGDVALTEEGSPYRTAYLGRPAHTATAGTADSGAVTLANSRLEAPPDGPDHVRYVSYEDGRDEAVVAVRATGALQYMVSLATALASPRFLDRALPVDRLEVIDDPPVILRDARCVGWLPEEAVEDGVVLREALVEAGEHLETLTTDLRRGEYDDRDRFRGEILRTAHGLAGTIVHLLDVVGVDFVREVRVPAGLDADHLAELARSVAVSAAIQSRYGAFASYRQLYEEREDKRRAALSPEVDAADPVGTVIGSYVVRGPDVHRCRSHLERHLGDPAEVHEDAPEFAVRVPVREAGREAVAQTASRILSRKRLRPTRAAVSVLHGLTVSPYAAAEALHQLGDVHAPREVRPDELRYALATLEPEALLPDAPPTVAKIVAALLRAEHRLSPSALAEAADVSARSVRRHRDVLAALDLVDVDTEDGWRLTLSFPTSEDRRAGGVLPRPVATETSFAEVVDAVAAALLTPEAYADPGGDVYETLLWPADPWALEGDPRLEGWIGVAAALVDAAPPTTERTVSMGPTIEQTPLSADTDTPAPV